MNCFVITTYCDTIKKVDELKKCIQNLNRFNIDILIHAHYPLDSDIQNSVKYYIYNSSNPIITNGSKVIIRWKWYVTAFKLLSFPKPDYSYAVMNQWKDSIKFLKHQGYNQIHIINYDTFISDNILLKHQKYLKNNDIVFEYFPNERLIYIAFISIKNTFFDTLIENLTLEKYLKSKDTMLETYIMELIKKYESQFKIKKNCDSNIPIKLEDVNDNYDIYTTIEFIDDFDYLKKTKDDKDLYWVFGGNNTEFDKFEILIFEILKPLNEIIIDIDGEIIKVNNITEKYYSHITNYTISDIIKIIDDNKLNIKIDGDIVNQNIIKRFKSYTISPKFE